MSEQLSLNFEGAPATISGLDLWREQRRAETESLARRLGLPIGHAVQIWLTSGTLLEGTLLLAEDDLLLDHERSTKLRLQIDRADFQASEIASCVRID